MKLSWRIVVTILALLSGIGILSAIVIIPSWNGILSIAQSIQQERVRIEKTANRAREIRQITADVNRIKEKLPVIETLFVEAGKEINLFSDLEEKSRKLGIIQTLRLGEARKETGGVSILPLDLELQSEYLRVLRFIAELEYSPLLLPLTVLDLRTDSNPQGGEKIFKARLRGNVYVK